MKVTRPATDYPLTIANVVPSDSIPGYRIEVPCVRCGMVMLPDPRGNFFETYDCDLVCDDCGHKDSPELMALLRQLRRPGPFTVTIGGPKVELDDKAWRCPICGKEGEPPDGWHVVDSRHGQPVCDWCLASLNGTLQQLRDALAAADCDDVG